MKRGARLEKNEQTVRSFERLRYCMSHSPILSMYDPQAVKYTVEADASGQSSGACLYQTSRDGVTRIVAYYSKVFSPEEKRYCVSRQEMTSIVRALRFWRVYLAGKTVHVKSDHACLQYLLKCKDLPPQWGRYLDLMAEFDLKIQYVPGSQQRISDYLSRYAARPCEEGNVDEHGRPLELCKQCRTREERVQFGRALDGRRKFNQQPAATRRNAYSSRSSAESQGQRHLVVNDATSLSARDAVDVTSDRAERGVSPLPANRGAARGVMSNVTAFTGIARAGAISRTAEERCRQPPVDATDGGARVPVDGIGIGNESDERIGQEDVLDTAGHPPLAKPEMQTQASGLEAAQRTHQAEGRDVGAAESRRVTTRAQSRVSINGTEGRDVATNDVSSQRRTDRAIQNDQPAPLSGNRRQHVPTLRLDDLWSHERIAQAQASDMQIATIKPVLETGIVPVDIAKNPDRDVQCYLKQRQSLVLRDGIMYRNFANSDGKTKYYQLVVPKELRESFLEAIHVVLLCHLRSQSKHEAHVSRYGFWPRWKTDVRIFVAKCRKCAEYHSGSKPPRNAYLRPSGGELATAGSRLSADLVGPLPPSNGFKYCLTISDMFTKFLHIERLRDKTAAAVARALLKFFLFMVGMLSSCRTGEASFRPIYLAKCTVFQELKGTRVFRTCPGKIRSRGLTAR